MHWRLLMIYLLLLMSFFFLVLANFFQATQFHCISNESTCLFWRYSEVVRITFTSHFRQFFPTFSKSNIDMFSYVLSISLCMIYIHIVYHLFSGFLVLCVVWFSFVWRIVSWRRLWTILFFIYYYLPSHCLHFGYDELRTRHILKIESQYTIDQLLLRNCNNIILKFFKQTLYFIHLLPKNWSNI